MKKRLWLNKNWKVVIALCIWFILGLFIGNLFVTIPYCNKFHKGIYLIDKEIIKIKITGSVEGIQRTFYHELGHHIWFKVINDTERKQYSIMINRTDVDTIQEDFAEWFAIYLYGQSGEYERNDFFKEIMDNYDLELYYKQ